MAAYFTSSSSVLSLSVVLLLISLSSARPSVKVTDDVLSTVCSKTKNPSLCLQTLKADPRAATGDLKGLCQVSIDLALAKAKDTKNYIGSLIGQSNGPSLKEKYLSCSENYENSIGDLQDATGLLNSGDYNGVNLHASAAMTETDDCEENFKEPPFDPSQLPKRDEDFDFLCSIILVISNLL